MAASIVDQRLTCIAVGRERKKGRGDDLPTMAVNRSVAFVQADPDAAIGRVVGAAGAAGTITDTFSLPATMPARLRLGVNVDHIATLRQARGTPYPDPVEGALLAAASGADSITIHLREDRRHIQDHDLARLLPVCPVPVNLEMAVTPAMIDIGVAAHPKYICLVPERREERTTEGGLDVAGNLAAVTEACRRLAAAGSEVSLFIAADHAQLAAAKATGAPNLEIHTGAYADAPLGPERDAELARISAFARTASAAGFRVHAGHGLNAENVGPIAAIPEILELNIGHALIARAVFIGLPAAMAELRLAMTVARKAAA